MKKVMRLVDENTGLMECRVCGHKHFANIKPYSNGKFYRGAWQCENGCNLDKKEIFDEKDFLEGSGFVTKNKLLSQEHKVNCDGAE